MDTRHLHVTVNLDALLGELQRSLQLTINLVAVALQSNLADGEEVRFPRGVISATFDSTQTWSTKEANERHKSWALTNGLRDVIEGVSAFLESAHQVLSVWALLERQNGGERLRMSEWEEEMEDGGKAFHRLGFPDKIAHIGAKHGVLADSTLAEQVLKINAARNCLVHRGGVVTDRDKNSDAGLTVAWRRLRIFLKDEDGERDLVIGEVTAKESMVCMQAVDHSKSFALGSRVTFTAQEFSDITWGLFSFGSDLVRRISAVGVSKGFVSPSPAQPTVQPDGPASGGSAG